MATATILRQGSGIDTSDANATAAQILTGYTGYVNDVLITGTMPNHGAVSQTLNCGGSYTIPAGYHNGAGKVTAASLASQTAGTATAAQVLASKTIWVAGVKITGTMTNRGAVTYSLPANGSYTIAAGYHNGSGKVSQALTTQAGSTITPGTANKTAVPSGRWVTGNVICAGASTLVAGNIKKGVTIFGVTGTWQGF